VGPSVNPPVDELVRDDPVVDSDAMPHEHEATRPPKLVVRDLVKEFPTRGRGQGKVLAIDHVNLEVADREFVCLVGSSGCGKSTLLNIVAGLDLPTSGTVEIDEEPVVGPGPDRGMVFQTYSLYPWRTVAENVAFGLECVRMKKAQRKERVDELLGIVGLTKFADHTPDQLSGGMRQRVAIARALAPEPDVLLLDEPFGALDAQTRRVMQDFLLKVWQRTQSTVVFVTHDIPEAIYLGSRVVVLASHPGRVIADIDVPFGPQHGPGITRDPRYLDLRDEIEDLLGSV
jgi:ABC-type nitrate/sulfonate/bicarbonate transport system ATPase subunit